MKKRTNIWRSWTKRSAMGVLLAIAALCLGLGGVRASSLRVVRAKSHSVKKGKATRKVASKSRKASLRTVAYKTPTHRRRRRSRRHHVVLPKQPSSQRTQEIQSALQRGGYYTGDPTGKWDSGTQDSLRRFQAANGLPPTGKLDALSLQKMGLGSDVAGVSAPRTVTPGTSATASATTAAKTPGA